MKNSYFIQCKCGTNLEIGTVYANPMTCATYIIVEPHKCEQHVQVGADHHYKELYTLYRDALTIDVDEEATKYDQTKAWTRYYKLKQEMGLGIGD